MLHSNSLTLPHHALAYRAITGVLDSADKGHLPPFAATLGMRYEEFSLIQVEHSKDSLLRLPFYFDLIAEWMPDLFPPLVEMLWERHSCDDKINWWVAHAIACACFGKRHLWQDLGLQGKEELSRLLASRFPKLYRHNFSDLDWNSFIFQELGQHLEIPNFIPSGDDKWMHFQLCLEP